MTKVADRMPAVPDAARAPGLGGRLWVHTAGLALLLVVLFPFMHPAGSFTSDEGAYALQVQALEQGSWVYDYRAAPLDPGLRAFPVINTDAGPSGQYTYVKHPAVPLALLYGTKILGRTLGLHLLSLLGVVGTAVAAWLVAAEIDPRLRVPAFWLAASGPVLINGFMLWAHAPSAALAGLALVGAARMAKGRITPLAAAGMVAALVGGVLVRSEGLLFAGALGAATAGARLATTRRPVPALSALGLIVAPAVIVAAIERQWISSIMGGSNVGVAGRGGEATSSFLAGRFHAAWHVLMNGAYLGRAPAVPMLLVLAVVVGLGLPALRRWGPDSVQRLTVAVAFAAALLVVRYVAFADETVTGLLTAAPLLALGVLLVRWRGSSPVAWLLGATAALFTAAILATQYTGSGGFEWGGRYLSAVLVPLSVLAALGLVRAIDGAPLLQRSRAVALVVALGAATSAFSLATSGTIRAGADAVIASVARHPSPVSVTTLPAIPRGSWRADRLTWMLTNDAGVPGLLQSLRSQGVAQVTVVVGRDVALSAMSAYPVLEEQDEPALTSRGVRLVIARS